MLSGVVSGYSLVGREVVPSVGKITAFLWKKIREMLDEVNPSCIIEVDGGVDANTCGICKENGAEVLVAGSAYFKAADKPAFVKSIEA